MDGHPHLFAERNDGDTYKWLERLARYSPIIHLQQTDGRRSEHLPFDDSHNQDGVIKADKVLRAIAKSYENGCGDEPSPCGEIYLTLEVFAGTAELPADIIRKLVDSVEYWRKFVPRDGLLLNQLL